MRLEVTVVAQDMVVVVFTTHNMICPSATRVAVDALSLRVRLRHVSAAQNLLKVVATVKPGEPELAAIASARLYRPESSKYLR
jgi:hypothetical protein